MLSKVCLLSVPLIKMCLSTYDSPFSFACQIVRPLSSLAVSNIAFLAVVPSSFVYQALPPSSDILGSLVTTCTLIALHRHDCCIPAIPLLNVHSAKPVLEVYAAAYKRKFRLPANLQADPPLAHSDSHKRVFVHADHHSYIADCACMAEPTSPHHGTLSKFEKALPSLVHGIAADAADIQITVQNQTAQVRQETRARLLRAVQQTYEDIFERAQIMPGHVYALKQSADQALDHREKPLCDWKYLQQDLQLPAWLPVLFRCAPASVLASANRVMYLHDSVQKATPFLRESL